MLVAQAGREKHLWASLTPAMFGFAFSKAWAYLTVFHLAPDAQRLSLLSFEACSAVFAFALALLALKASPAKLKKRLLPISTAALLAAACFFIASHTAPQMAPALDTMGNLLGALGVMGLAALWTDLYALLNPIRATLFASGSIVLAWFLGFALEANPAWRLFILTCVIALLAYGCYRKSAEKVLGELHHDDDRRCRYTVPYRAVLFIASYSLAYGLISGLVPLYGRGTPAFRALPALLVLVMLFASAKRFSVRTLYNIAFPTMAGGILVVALLPGVPPEVGAPLINFSYGAMSLMVTVVACTISYASSTSALWVFGLFVAVQYVSKLLGEWLHGAIGALFWSGGADGAVSLVAIAFVAVASVVMLAERSAFSQWGGEARPGDADKSDPMAPIRTRIDDLSQAYQLTQREIEVLHLMAEGKTNHGISQDMFIAESTVKVHVQHIYQKLGIHSRKELARLLGAPDAEGGSRT